ncbi:MAG: hypothetical protein IPP17_24685 [Bacteroidetes bacterium]|nr:hypothetical protein [Bacteroidota bacterium]
MEYFVMLRLAGVFIVPLCLGMPILTNTFGQRMSVMTNKHLRMAML